jgi:hypothetical protein
VFCQPVNSGGATSRTTWRICVAYQNASAHGPKHGLCQVIWAYHLLRLHPLHPIHSTGRHTIVRVRRSTT